VMCLSALFVHHCSLTINTDWRNKPTSSPQSHWTYLLA
jgi:hypothetical protein